MDGSTKLKAKCTFIILVWYCSVMLESKAAAELLVHPLWENAGTTSPCSINRTNNTEKMVAVHGSSSVGCSVHITADSSSRTTLVLTDISQNGYSFFVYVEREGDLETSECRNRFVGITGQIETCNITFLHPNLTVHILGGTKLFLYESFPSDVAFKCPESGDVSDISESTKFSYPHVKGYNEQITCIQYDNVPGHCKLIFSTNCNATLMYREVEYVCLDANLTLSHRALIYYSDDLNSLDLSYNNIQSINVNAFIDLKCLNVLRLNNNVMLLLEDGAFNGLDNVRELWLSTNMLKYIQQNVFHDMRNLYVLALDNNALETLDQKMFRNLFSLVSLFLNNNNIITLFEGTFSGLTNLNALSLFNNQLMKLDSSLFSTISNLANLDIYGNFLRALPTTLLRGLHSLQFLNLGSNMISALPEELFSGLTNLQILYLFNNYIEFLPENLFHGMERLSVLNLSNNRLISIYKKTFEGLRSLSSLHLTQNNLIHLNVFEGLRSLSSLHFTQNNLVHLNPSVFHGLNELTQLSLDVNSLRVLPERLFWGLQNLRFLNLAYNNLMALPNDLFNGLEKLRELWIHNNRLETLDPGIFSGLHMLTDLTLESNKLKTLPVGLFSGLLNLVELLMTNNRLVRLDLILFDDLISLKVLTLDSNLLVDLPDGVFKALHQLKILSLRKNRIENLNSEHLNSLKELTLLDLSVNRLTRLGRDMFKYCRNITFLDLSENKLKDVPEMRYLSHLTYLYLNQNPLSSITLSSFSDLSRHTQVQASQHEICECYAPEGVNCSASNDRSPYLTCDRLLSDRVLVIMMWLIGLNALLGNMLVLIWRYMVIKSFKVQDLFLFNLAASDFLMGVYMIIIASADIVFGENFPMQSETWRSSSMCRIAGAIAITSSEASVFFLTLISIDRFFGIRHPLSARKLTKKTAFVVKSAAWVISLAMGIVASAFAAGRKNFKFYDNSHVCIGLPLALIKSYSTEEFRTVIHIPNIRQGYNKSFYITTINGFVAGTFFSTAVFLGLNAVCYLIIFTCYIMIIKYVRKTSKLAGRSREMTEQIKLTTKVTTIVATDFLCWFPIIILGILVQSRALTLPSSVFAWLVTFVLPINSAINPYLYAISDLLSKQKEQKRLKETSQRNSIRMISNTVP